MNAAFKIALPLVGLPLCLTLAACGDSELPGCDDEGNPSVVCPGPIEVVCTGPLTEVDLSSAGACGDAVATDDRPEGGFVVGMTDVVFTADGESCTTEVTVTDDVPPTVTCPAQVTVLVTAADEPPQVLGAEASDNCTDNVALSTETLDPPSGETTVEVIATDLAGNEARCQTSGNVVRVLAPTQLTVAHAEIAGAMTSVTLTWEPDPDTGATAYRVFRADDPDSDFVAVADVPAPGLSYVDSTVSVRASYRVQALAGQLEGGTSTTRTAHAVAAADYDLRNRSVPNINFATTLYGVVRHPADLSAGPYPLVVMMHGNHGICRSSPTDPNDTCQISNNHECPNGFTTPNAEGLSYVAETLAAQGFIAVTVSANAMNCRNNFIPERAELLAEHLRQWSVWSSAAGDAPFGTQFSGAVDLEAVGLFGHSRGAEAVSVVPGLLAQNPISGVELAGVYALAPTDFVSPEVVDAPYLLSLPGCDGDVSDLQGIDIYDRSFTAANPETKSQAFFIGANHNFFNTNWEFDDGGFVCGNAALVGDLAQMRMLERSAGDWFRATLQGESVSPDQSADAPSPASLAQLANEDVDVRWSYAAPGRTVIEDFTDGDVGVNELGLTNTAAGFSSATLCNRFSCGDEYRHQLPGIRLSWNGGTPIFRANLGGADLTGQTSLSFRAVSVDSGLNTNLSEQSFIVRLVDDAGQSANIVLLDTQLLPHLYSGSNRPHEVLQTVRTPLDDFLAINPDLDLSAIAAFELEMSVAGHTTGSIALTDIELHE